MRGPTLITPGAPERAALRHWLAEDAQHATLAVCHGRYAIEDGLRFLIGCGIGLAMRAKMPQEVGREVAVSVFWDVLDLQEGRLAAARWEIVEAAKRCLTDDPEDYEAAAIAAAAVARLHHAPDGMVAFGLRVASRAV